MQDVKPGEKDFLQLINFFLQKFNDPFQKLVMNVYHFSKQSPDFSAYDISPCFMDTEMMHLMVC